MTTLSTVRELFLEKWMRICAFCVSSASRCVHYIVFCVEVIACPLFLQDALYKEYSCQISKKNMPAVIETLKKSHQALRVYKSNPEIGIKFLEGVAGVRFALMEITSLLYSEISSKKKSMPFKVLLLAKDVCTDEDINTTDFSGEVDIVGPAVYLIKLLVRQFGFPCLKSISERHQWIVPRDLRRTNQVSTLAVCIGMYTIYLYNFM